jgi:hypothetical protein
VKRLKINDITEDVGMNDEIQSDYDTSVSDLEFLFSDDEDQGGAKNSNEFLVLGDKEHLSM